MRENKIFSSFLQKGIDKRGRAVYNTRVPKTAGSRKSESHPAEEVRFTFQNMMYLRPFSRFVCAGKGLFSLAKFIRR